MSHPTQTLRDKVWSVLNNVWAGDSEEDLYIKTDAILDLVREALLSNEAVEAGARSLHSEEHLFVGEWEVPHELFDGRLIEDGDKEGYRFSSSRAITAALDAVTGEGGER